MSVHHIESPQNTTIKSVAQLRTRRGRRQQAKIIIDGRREVRRAIQFGVPIQSIFGPVDLVGDFDDGAIEIYSLSDRALAKIAYGDRREIVAVANTPSRPIVDLQVGESPLVAVLAKLEKPGNVGAILRSADAAGIDAVVAVDSAELFNPNTIRASLGTVFSLPIAEATFQQYQQWALERDLQHFLAKCEARAVDYREVDYRQSCSIVLGSEATGIAEDWGTLARSVNITLPMHGSVDSLNVSCAAAVLFYQAAGSRRL